MSGSVTQDTVTILVPLMLVIVERFSTLARGMTGNYEDLAGSTPFFMPDKVVPNGIYKGQLNKTILPELGRFNHLHVTNTAILALSFILITPIDTKPLKNVLGMLVALVWVQLPILEIDAYGEIREEMNGAYPGSMYFHIVTTLLLIAAIAGPFESGKILTSIDIFSSEIVKVVGFQDQMIAGGGLIVLWVGSWFGFLHLFENEVESANGAGDGYDIPYWLPQFITNSNSDE